MAKALNRLPHGYIPYVSASGVGPPEFEAGPTEFLHKVSAQVLPRLENDMLVTWVCCTSLNSSGNIGHNKLNVSCPCAQMQHKLRHGLLHRLVPPHNYHIPNIMCNIQCNMQCNIVPYMPEIKQSYSILATEIEATNGNNLYNYNYSLGKSS